VQFNLSHTPGMLVFAISLDRPVGIDVEAVRPHQNFDALGRRFLHPGEWEAIAALPDSQRSQAFAAIWTCKEAYLKARGEGLSGGVGSFALRQPIIPGRDVFIETADEPARQNWWVRSLDVGEGFAAAVAAPARPRKCPCWDWPETY
jgi:4'-phosphopantetheinyl transferase